MYYIVRFLSNISRLEKFGYKKRWDPVTGIPPPDSLLQFLQSFSGRTISRLCRSSVVSDCQLLLSGHLIPRPQVISRFKRTCSHDPAQLRALSQLQTPFIAVLNFRKQAHISFHIRQYPLHIKQTAYKTEIRPSAPR